MTQQAIPLVLPIPIQIEPLLPKGNFEIVREKLVEILTGELLYQRELSVYILASGVQPGTQIPLTPQQKEDLALTRDSINTDTTVWEERFNPYEAEENPYINVYVDKDSFEATVEANSGEQTGTVTYTFELGGFQLAEPNATGRLTADKRASKKVTRMASLIRAILMNPNYAMLQLSGIVGNVSVVEFRKVFPTSQTTAIENVVGILTVDIMVAEDGGDSNSTEADDSLVTSIENPGDNETKVTTESDITPV